MVDVNKLKSVSNSENLLEVVHCLFNWCISNPQCDFGGVNIGTFTFFAVQGYCLFRATFRWLSFWSRSFLFFVKRMFHRSLWDVWRLWWKENEIAVPLTFANFVINVTTPMGVFSRRQFSQVNIKVSKEHFPSAFWRLTSISLSSLLNNTLSSNLNTHSI